MSLVIDGVSRRFGSTTALDDVSIEARDGEFLVLLGPSGCGKSTLLRIIAGLLEPTEGRVLIGDRDVTAMSPGDRDIAMVFQSYALYPHLTVRRNLGFGLRARGLPKAEVEASVASVAERLQLTPLLDRRPRALSGGQRQRVALGRAMVRDPVAFLMDEPLSNLDAKLRTATRVELTELHRSLGATFVYVTHDQVEAMTMATRIVVLNAGRVEQIGTPTEIYDQPATAFVASFMGAPPMNLLPATVSSRDGRVRVDGDGITASLWQGSVEDRPVLLGLRPEHLQATTDGSGAEVAIAARVVAIENLGNEEIAVCEAGETRVAIRRPRPIGLAIGERVTLAADAADAALFDAETGRRLHWRSDAPNSAETPTATLAGSR